MNYFIHFCFWYVLLCFICDTLLVILEADEVADFEEPANLKQEPYSFNKMLEMHFITHILFLLSPFLLIAEITYLIAKTVKSLLKK